MWTKRVCKLEGRALREQLEGPARRALSSGLSELRTNLRDGARCTKTDHARRYPSRTTAQSARPFRSTDSLSQQCVWPRCACTPARRSAAELRLMAARLPCGKGSPNPVELHLEQRDHGRYRVSGAGQRPAAPYYKVGRHLLAHLCIVRDHVLSHNHIRQTGMPRRTPDPRVNLLHVRLSPAKRERVDARARREYLSPSSRARQLILRALKDRQASPPGPRDLSPERPGMAARFGAQSRGRTT